MRRTRRAGLQLGASALYDDAYIVQFNCPPKAATSCNVNGQPLPFAPRFKVTSNASYSVPLSDEYTLRLASDYDWQSKTQDPLTETPDTVQAAYGLWNANVSLLADVGQWRVTGLVKNITDQHYSSYLAFGSFGGVIRYGPRDVSRYFGIEFRKNF